MSVNKRDSTTGELVTLASGTRMWVGTKAAHDLAVQQGTMPNNCMVCITDDAAGEEAWQYSTSETNTGKTWIDGKPIYRKVVDLGNLPNAASKSVAHNISNIDAITDIRGVFKDSNNVFASIPFAGASDMARNVTIYSSATVVTVATGADRSTESAYAILEYTKTTD